MTSPIAKLRELLAAQGDLGARGWDYDPEDGFVYGVPDIDGAFFQQCRPEPARLAVAMRNALPALLDIADVAALCAVELVLDDSDAPYVYVPRRDVEALRAALARLGEA